MQNRKKKKKKICKSHNAIKPKFLNWENMQF